MAGLVLAKAAGARLTADWTGRCGTCPRIPVVTLTDFLANQSELKAYIIMQRCL